MVVVALVASWAGNIYSHETGRLPEGRFLSHLIEVTDSPGDSFMLYYIANNDDKRLPVSVSIEGLPALQFYPISAYMTFRNQKLYRLIGHFEPGEQKEDSPSEAAAPLTIRSVDVNYSDGTRGTSDIGKRIVYRGEDRGSDGSIGGVSTSGSTVGTRTATFRVEKPVTATGFSSSLLNEIGSAFTYELYFGTETAVFPRGIEAGTSISLMAAFPVPVNSQLYLQPVAMRLRLAYTDKSGIDRVQMIPMERHPYPTQSAIREYVKAQRRSKE